MTSDRNELELGHGERLPWLETAEEYDTRRRRGWGVVVAALLGALALLLIVGGIYFTQRGRATEGDGELIAAPPGDYKVRAVGDDGMRVGNESDAMLAASEGQEASGRIAAAPAAPPPALGPSTIAMPAGVPAPAATPTPPQPASAKGATVQLGALADEPSARAVWERLAREQSALGQLSHSIERVVAGGKTVYRLRAGVPDRAAANALCNRLQKAKVACFVVS